MRTFAIAIRKQNDCRHKIGIWCNGNTTDSGPVIPGSSPGIPTKRCSQRVAFFYVTTVRCLVGRVCGRIILALKIFSGHICKVILVAGSKIIPCPEIPIKYLQSQFLFILAKQYGYRCKIIWFFRNLVEAKFTKRHLIS